MSSMFRYFNLRHYPLPTAPPSSRASDDHVGRRVLTLKLEAGSAALWGLFFLDRSCSGRGHALRRIDLYPVEGLGPRTTIALHVGRSRAARAATTLLLGSGEPSIFPVAARLTAAAASSRAVLPQAFKVAPTGTTPCARKRQSAIASFRARATIPTLRPRMPVLPKRSRHQRESALCGW